MPSRKPPKPTALDTVVLTSAEAAVEFRLAEEDAEALVGSGVRVPRAWLEEYRTRMGPLDFTIADCSLLTGTPVNAIHKWRLNGVLKIRATSKAKKDRILVTPAELVRVLREIAEERSGTTELTVTPAQERKRDQRGREETLRMCRGEI